MEQKVGDGIPLKVCPSGQVSFVLKCRFLSLHPGALGSKGEFR